MSENGIYKKICRMSKKRKLIVVFGALTYVVLWLWTVIAWVIPQTPLTLQDSWFVIYFFGGLIGLMVAVGLIVAVLYWDENRYAGEMP